MTKKVYKQKMFFSILTKNLNWETLPKSLVTFKRWDGIRVFQIVIRGGVKFSLSEKRIGNFTRLKLFYRVKGT